MNSARTLLSTLALLLGACSGGPAPPPDAAPIERDSGPEPDPVFGAWFAQLDVIDDRRATLTLNSDLTFVSVYSQENPRDAFEHRGCTEEVTDAGTFTLGTDAGRRALDALVNVGISGRARWTSCDDPSEDGTGYAPVAFMGGHYPFTIEGSTLTLHASGGDIALTRQ